MSVRDIIKAATPGPWRAKGRKGIEADGAFYGAPARRDIVSCLSPNPGYACDSQKRWSAVAEANRDFIATFDPEHQSLIESLVEAGDPEPLQYDGSQIVGVPNATLTAGNIVTTTFSVTLSPQWVAWRKRQDLRDALTAYRRERGLL